MRLHAERFPDEDDYYIPGDTPNLNWRGEIKTIQTKIGELSFYPHVGNGRFGCTWEPIEETRKLIDRYLVNIRYRPSSEVQGDYHKRVPLDILSNFDISFTHLCVGEIHSKTYYFNLPPSLEDWWQSLDKTDMLSILKREQIIQERMDEILSKGWETAFVSYFGKIGVKTIFSVEGVRYKVEIDIAPDSEIPEAAPLVEDAIAQINKENQIKAINLEIKTIYKKPLITKRDKERIATLNQQMEELNHGR